MEPADILTVAETSKILRISESMVRKILKNGGPGYLRIGTRVVIPRRSLEAWIEKNTVRGNGE